MTNEDSFPGTSEFLGDYRLRPRVVYERGTRMLCIYCSSESLTREHAPSKTLLKKPFPDNLPTVPSCEKCNNSFSKDELYTAVFIELLKNAHYKEIYPLDQITQDRITKRKEGMEAKFIFDSLVTPTNYKDIRIERVLEKLAVCHAVYELSEGYHSISWSGKAKSLAYSFLPDMSDAMINEMNEFIFMDNRILPEIGSIAYNHICIIEYSLQNQAGEIIHIKNLMLDWTEIQAGQYRYICYLEPPEIHVVIVIGEYLYAHITFEDLCAE